VFNTAEPSSHEAAFVALLSGRQPTPDLWADALLAALAQSLDSWTAGQLDSELATFDRGFRSFKGLKLRFLIAPEK
jgi:predicted nucleic acid-binding protein